MEQADGYVGHTDSITLQLLAQVFNSSKVNGNTFEANNSSGFYQVL